MTAICVIEGCGGRRFGRGWCNKHYRRWWKSGDPLVCRTIPGEVQEWLARHSTFEGEECLAWPFGKNASGYGVVTYKGRQTSAQFAMCEIAHGPPPTPKHEAAHSCGKGREGCVNPQHLRWATSKENSADMIGHGTVARGDKQGSSKLTPDDVREIRRLAGQRLQKDIAAQFGIKQVQVSRIIHRHQWAWLT